MGRKESNQKNRFNSSKMLQCSQFKWEISILEDLRCYKKYKYNLIKCISFLKVKKMHDHQASNYDQYLPIVVWSMLFSLIFADV